MASKHAKASSTFSSYSRRDFMASTLTAAGVAAYGLGIPTATHAQDVQALRWGFVGTGGIANSMARMVTRTPLARLQAVSSRRMESAQEFAAKHGADLSFDSWQAMCESDDVDAIYVATPTSVREEISIAAASAGKHVLGEKPFASAASVERIIKACRENDVAFMDGTHFAHHPRTLSLRSNLDQWVGNPRRLDSAFQFPLANTGNIRLNPELEPMGAIGDAGWYNMRAIVEYLGEDIDINGVGTYLRRRPDNGAVVGASGVISFDNGSSSTWKCGFDVGAVSRDLTIDGINGHIEVENFLGQNPDGSASYRLRSGRGPEATDETVRVESTLPGAVLMFEDYAAQVHDASLREHWAQGTLRTQRLLDAVWQNALANERDIARSG